MKCQILFSGKNKKNINLSSAENAQRVVKVNDRKLCTKWHSNENRMNRINPFGVKLFGP